MPPRARPIQPSELIELAYELAGRDHGRGRPKTVRLRRGVSTAYYGLFHQLSHHSALVLLGGVPGGGAEAAVARWISHTSLQKLCMACTSTATGPGRSALTTALGILDQRVVDIAAAFLELQDARESADYDDEWPVSKAQALRYVRQADRATQASVALYSGDESSYLRFLRLAMGSTFIAKNR